MLICALFCGIALGGVYDILRITRYLINGADSNDISPRVRALRERFSLPPALQLPKKKNKRPSNKRKTIISAIVLFIQDLLFCLLFALAASLLLYQTNDGQLRLSAIVVMLLGFILYLVTVGRWSKRFWTLLTILVQMAFCWIGALLIYPLRLLWQYLKKPLQRLAEQMRRLYHHVTHGIKKRKQACLKRKQKKDQNIVMNVGGNRRLAGQCPDGKRIFVSGGKRK